MPVKLSMFNNKILRVLRLVRHSHRKFTTISISETIYIEWSSIFYHYGVLIKKIDRPVISEDIVELSNSMENLVVLSAEGENTENGEF